MLTLTFHDIDCVRRIVYRDGRAAGQRQRDRRAGLRDICYGVLCNVERRSAHYDYFHILTSLININAEFADEKISGFVVDVKSCDIKL